MSLPSMWSPSAACASSTPATPTGCPGASSPTGSAPSTGTTTRAAHRPGRRELDRVRQPGVGVTGRGGRRPSRAAGGGGLPCRAGNARAPVWYADEAQYVPAQLAANEAKIVVPGAGQSARAWEISTTEIHELASERVAGGKEVTLHKFDVTSAVLFTADETLIERFIRKMETLREPAARVSLELARAKFARVAAVDLELHKLGKGQPDAGWILEAARVVWNRPRPNCEAQRFHESRMHSTDALQHLRNLQQALLERCGPPNVLAGVEPAHALFSDVARPLADDRAVRAGPQFGPPEMFFAREISKTATRWSPKAGCAKRLPSRACARPPN